MINYNEFREGQKFYGNGYKKGYEDAKKEFERPTGEWVGINEYIKHLEEETSDRYEVSSLYNGSIFCNQCWGMNKEKSRFCPKCGADMKGDRK